jgi:hypothetical protein
MFYSGPAGSGHPLDGRLGARGGRETCHYRKLDRVILPKAGLKAANFPEPL